MKPRYSERVAVKCPVVFTLGSMVGEGQVQNLTNPGCMIESAAYVSKGEYLQLKMYLPEMKTPLAVEMGVVRWTNGLRFGVEFIKMSGADRSLLGAFMSRHQHQGWRRATTQADIPSVDTVRENEAPAN